MSDLVISVSSLDKYLDMRLREDPFLSDIWVEGEVNGARRVRGICYFSLKDATASVECMAWREVDQKFADIIQEGTQIQIRGQVTFYDRSGKLSFNVREAKAVGEGEQRQKLLELQKKLEAQGCFAASRKRPLPAYPHKIAIITSRDGAALTDIRKISEARNPTIKRVLYPVTVQGRDAARTVTQALDQASRDPDIDVIIVSRGGGSASDLSAFNDPQVVYAVTRASAPVISAVGHERDITFCDMAADVRASTPSNAAELAVPESASITRQINVYKEQMERRMHTIFGRREADLNAQRSVLRSRGIRFRVGQVRTQVDLFRNKAKARVRTLVAQKRGELNTYAAKIKALDPRAIVSSGYAVVLRDGLRINKAVDLHAGDRIQLMFADGTVPATVTEGEADE